MDEYEALKAITINAASNCGIDDRVGSIKAGKDADITIFNGHPLDFRTRAEYVLINGKIVYERKE
jgi:imidazolonepropionase-like amidohydrolase